MSCPAPIGRGFCTSLSHAIVCLYMKLCGTDSFTHAPTHTFLGLWGLYLYATAYNADDERLSSAFAPALPVFFISMAHDINRSRASIRAKTYLTSTMRQVRLNHIAFLRGHKELARKISLNVMADDFIRTWSVQRNTLIASRLCLCTKYSELWHDNRFQCSQDPSWSTSLRP